MNKIVDFLDEYVLYLYWVTPHWWQYIVWGTSWPPAKWEKASFGWRKLFCRIQGHPAGVVWFNCSGLEPDMTCRNCGDCLG